MPTHIARAREPEQTSGTPVIDRSSEAIARHLEDAAHFPGGHADGVARPRSEAEVAALIKEATRVLPVGAQSSVTGGATPVGGLVLSTERLLLIQDSGQHHVRANAGISLDALQKMLSATGRWYAPIPTFTGATVGGIVSTNAAGAATFKYGATRPWVDGLTVVLPCGHVLDLTRGDVTADAAGWFEIVCAHGIRRFRRGSYVPPAVPKCSAGYFTAPSMDLIDLFIGAEGTLGVVVTATLRVLPARPVVTFVLVPVPSESVGLALVNDLRRASIETWKLQDSSGIDIAAIESLDRRCLDLLHEDGVDRRTDITWPAGTELLLIIQLERPAGTPDTAIFHELSSALEPGASDSAVGRFARLLQQHGVGDAAEVALPSQVRRAEQILAFREGAPTGVNRRVGDARRTVDPRIDKTAADMIVPFEHFGEMMQAYRLGFARRGLDHAIWGHISDGNVHPNVIPRSYDDVLAAREAILEFGREAVRLGGCPLAEHGVGRSPLKQRLLRKLYGDKGLEDMRAIRRAMDPEGRLAPGVIFNGSR
jgi:D-lactate dehydrogenase (cytochrome)